MLRRGRASAFASATVVVAALAVAGCGRNDFNNDPRPPIPAEVSVKIATRRRRGLAQGVRRRPGQLHVANLTNQTGSLAIHGPVDADSDQIQPGGAETVKVDMKTGSYEASVDGIAVRPFSFTVGPERPSGKNDLLLP